MTRLFLLVSAGSHRAWRAALPVLAVLMTLAQPAVSEEIALPLKLTWGHRSTSRQPFHVKLTGEQLTLSESVLIQGESGDVLENGVARTMAGVGDIDGWSCTLRCESKTIVPINNAQQIWKHLFKHGDAGATQRLQADPAYRPDPRTLTVALDDSGTRGFSVSVDQLLSQTNLWIPEFDLMISVGATPTSFQAHVASLRGERILDRVQREPEATYADFTARWEDMGNPAYNNPHPIPPGHIVCLAWDSSLHKFGVDRMAAVQNDYGKLERFHLSLDFGDPNSALNQSWKGQLLADGLPVITTTFEKGGVRCEIEQFAYPLDGPSSERRGDLKMVLLQKVRLTALSGKPELVPVTLIHDRDFLIDQSSVAPRYEAQGLVVEDGAERALLVLQGTANKPEVTALDAPKATAQKDEKVTTRKHRIAVAIPVPGNGATEFIVKLPSPALPKGEVPKLLALDYAACRARALQFWNDYLEKGALFKVPEAAVNTLFRANLWHALRLPRRQGGVEAEPKMDLPYSNFAYDQKGTPWPVNQSVYVDYMLYDLRGYHSISEEEHAVIYRNNQEPNGHVGGFANWGVYTPGMLYSVSQHYLLSGDRASFERLLPQTLHGLDWCLGEMKRANAPENPAPGLILAPLNDMAHEVRSWAFNQAYFAAGVDLFARALQLVGHPRADECRIAAQTMRTAIQREFGRASLRAPAVQLADGTWSRYVPSDAQISGRMFQAWYPNDVDTGPLHLSRLKALDPTGPLTTAILNDHEDNLLFHQWGAINEPVYNMQGTAYLLRDEPKAAIRTFYSTMACSFSHTVFEPVEHRWGWPQYFGPPSTDGSWFELYRNMLIHERDDDVLVIGQATPRAWLEDGKRIEVRRAPTYYGPMALTMESRASKGELVATVELSQRKRPAELLVRFRHPQQKEIRSVTVNGQASADFDTKREWVRIANPSLDRYVITTHYEPSK